MFLDKISCDFSRKWQTGFQDPATPVMEGIIDLHHNIFFFLIIILLIVLFVFNEFFEIFVIPFNEAVPKISYYLKEFLKIKSKRPEYLELFSKNLRSYYLDAIEANELMIKYRNFTHNSLIEIIWTIIPSLVLILIAIPSFMLLYAIDEIVYPQTTIKIMGHQWFWSYESYDIFNENAKTIYKYDSYMKPSDELDIGQLRLLEVDLPLYLPIRTHIRLLISSSDVLHSWAVPALGIKMDAVPGRLNQVSLFIKRSGTFYGQCSEICGINHGFMPIVIQALPINTYLKFFVN